MEKEFYRVLDSRVPELALRIGKLNKRAKKLGVPEIVVNNVGTETVRVLRGSEGNTFEAPIDYSGALTAFVVGTRTYQHLTVTGQTPKLAGWTFVGTLQHLKDEETGENLTVLRAVPGEVIPSDYRTRAQWCDHCKLNRRRRDTYIVRNDRNQVKQVGSDCIKDFLGGVSPEQILASLEIFLSAEDLLSGSEGGFGEGGDDLAIWRDSYLEHVAAIIRRDGWLSRGKARDFGGQATADAALDYFNIRNNGNLRPLVITDDDRKLVADAVEWGRSLTGINRDGTENDYEWNLRVSLNSETIKARTEGIVASLIAAYNRHVEHETRQRVKRDNSKSEFIGTVRKREVFDLVLIAEPTWHQSDFGSYAISRYLHNNQNEVVWFGQGGVGKVGESVTVKATVKRHEERNGVKQTIINRVTEVK